MISPVLVYSWKGRPAVADARTGKAWAILVSGGHWEAVSFEEIILTGELRRGQTLDEAFPGLPPLPRSETS